MKEEQHLQIYGRSREEIGMKTCFHSHLDYAKTLKLRFRVGDLDQPERRKLYASSREEKEIAQMCPCGKAVESRTHIVGECETYKEGRDVSEENRRMWHGEVWHTR